jgi:hypothetical protein
MICSLNSDGLTIIPIQIASGNLLKISSGTSGTDYGPYEETLIDSNGVRCLMGVSSENYTDPKGNVYIQGVTPVVIYADSNGNLLTQST